MPSQRADPPRADGGPVTRHPTGAWAQCPHAPPCAIKPGSVTVATRRGTRRRTRTSQTARGEDEGNRAAAVHGHGLASAAPGGTFLRSSAPCGVQADIARDDKQIARREHHIAGWHLNRAASLTPVTHRVSRCLRIRPLAGGWFLSCGSNTSPPLLTVSRVLSPPQHLLRRSGRAGLVAGALALPAGLTTSRHWLVLPTVC